MRVVPVMPDASADAPVESLPFQMPTLAEASLLVRSRCSFYPARYGTARRTV